MKNNAHENNRRIACKYEFGGKVLLLKKYLDAIFAQRDMGIPFLLRAEGCHHAER